MHKLATLFFFHRRRRVAPKPKRKILRCKKPLLLSTFNLRTLRARSTTSNAQVLKTDELCYKLNQFVGKITGIQETKIKHEKDRRKMVNSYTAAFGYTLYTVSAWENNQQAATGGIGLMLGKTSHELLIGVQRISDLAILTDANARLGKDVALFTYSGTTNNNGNRHLEVMEEHRLVAANTLFQKRPGKLWTWTSPHNTHHQLDYIFVRSKWKNSVTKCEAYSTLGLLFSDHRIVTAKVSLRLRSTKPNASIKITKYIWSDLATNKEMQERYAVEVRNRYQLLLNESEEPAERDYDKFVQATSEAARVSETCPKKQEKGKESGPQSESLERRWRRPTQPF